MPSTEVPVLHKAQELLKDFTGDLLVLDSGEIERGDLVFYSGHLIRRMVTAPRERRCGEFYVHDVESIDGGSRGRNWQMVVGAAHLVLRPKTN